MDWSLALKILVGVVAVLLGVFLGMPGKGGQDPRRPGRYRIGKHDEKQITELEQALGRAARRSGSAKRYFTPLDLLRRDVRASRRRRQRRYFTTAAPSHRTKPGPRTRK